MKYFGRLLLFMIAMALTTGCQNSQFSSGLLGNSTSGSSVSSGRTQLIQATANDPNGVTKVEFYVNGILTCTITSSPYNCPWSVPGGAGTSYQLQTKAYDAQGKVGSSQIVSVVSR